MAADHLPADSTPHQKFEEKSAGWLRYFERVTSGGTFLPWIDGLRFLAIVAVILYHLNGYVLAKGAGFTEADARSTSIFRWLVGANCGVQLFFSISGFILALPFAKESVKGRPVRLRDYFLRRITRLEPPFLINLAIATGLLVLVRRESLSELWPNLLATMTYLHNWIWGEHSRINGVAWSLEIEVQFYVLAPFLLRPYFRASERIRRVCVSGIVGLYMLTKAIAPVHGPMGLRLGLLYQIDHFLVGILVADLFVVRWCGSPGRHRAWDLIALLVFPLTFWSQRTDSGTALLPLFSTLILLCAMLGPMTNQLLSIRGITLIGGMCYSIYLYHFYLLSAFGRFTLGWTSGWSFTSQLIAQSFALVPPTLVVCAMLFATFERPFMAWKPFDRKSSHANG